jgi:hypothetical protein
MLAACALLPVLEGDLFMSDDESNMEFIGERVNLYPSDKDSKMEGGKKTGFSMVTCPMSTNDGREAMKSTKRGRKSLKLTSVRAITKAKVNKGQVEIFPVTSIRGSTKDKVDNAKVHGKDKKTAILVL